jgi:hypothetical protein
MDPVDNVANVPVHAAEAGLYQATGLVDCVLSSGDSVSQENSSSISLLVTVPAQRAYSLR